MPEIMPKLKKKYRVRQDGWKIVGDFCKSNCGCQPTGGKCTCLHPSSREQ